MTILLFQNSPVQYPVVWIISGFAIVVAVIQRLSKWAKQKNDFLNDKGERIKEIPVDARLFKFVRSLELSKQGQQLAGSQPYLIRSGPYNELVISQPDHIQDFYKHDAKRHEKPKNFNLGHLFGRLAGDAVGAQYGDDWRKIRKHFDPPFAFHPTMQNKSRFDVEIRQWIEGLTPSARNEVNSAVSFKFLTFRLLALHLYGDAFDDRIYWRMLELNDMHEGVIRSLLTSKWPDSKLWNMLPNAANRQLSRFLSQWKDFNAMIIEHARGGRWNCPVEVIYRGVNPDNEITEEQFLSTLDEILFTNVDVSAGVLSTIFTRLASSPSIQNALRDEIKLWKGRPDLGEAKYLAKSDTLLNRVIMESMRISPAFWFSMPESTSETKKIGGYLIPANTTVVIDTRRLNNEAITWGNDSADFNPDRFLKLPQEKLRCGFMRFGTGAASGRCLGKNVADVLFKLTTVAIVERFSLESLSLSGGEKVGRGLSNDVRICRL